MLASGGSFGDTLLDASLEVPLTLGRPLHGCTPLVGPAHGRAVVIERGECMFVEKARVAQQGGAATVIIVDHQPNGMLLSMSAMGAKSSDITIPTFFISRQHGQQLRGFLERHDSDALVVRATVRNTPGQFQIPAMPGVVTYMVSGLEGVQLNVDALFAQLFRNGQIQTLPLDTIQTLHLAVTPAPAPTQKELPALADVHREQLLQPGAEDATSSATIEPPLLEPEDQPDGEEDAHERDEDEPEIIRCDVAAIGPARQP